MTNNFAATLTSWHDFYILSGTAAATLVGLLFVAVSIKLDYLADPANAEQRRRIVNSFEGFVYVLLFALVFLIPDNDMGGLGWPLLILSVLRVISVEQGAWRSFREYGRAFWTRDVLFAYQLPAAGYLVVVWFTVPLIQGRQDTNDFGWFVGVILALLASAAGSAWDLMLRVERPARHDSVEELQRK